MRANCVRALIACGAGVYLAASAHSVVLAEYRKKEMTAGAGRYLWQVEHDVKEEVETVESEAPVVVDIYPEERETESLYFPFQKRNTSFWLDWLLRKQRIRDLKRSTM